MIVAMLVLRLFPVLSLVMVLWTGAMASAYVQGPQRQADGSFVICSGTGTTIVSVTNDGEEQSVTMPCPNCLVHAWAGELAAFDAPSAPITFARYVHGTVVPVAPAQRNRAPQLARAPPILV